MDASSSRSQRSCVPSERQRFSSLLRRQLARNGNGGGAAGAPMGGVGGTGMGMGMMNANNMGMGIGMGMSGMGTGMGVSGMGGMGMGGMGGMGMGMGMGGMGMGMMPPMMPQMMSMQPMMHPQLHHQTNWPFMAPRSILSSSSSSGPVGAYSEATAMSRKMVMEATSSAAAADESASASAAADEYEPYHPSLFIDAVLQNDAEEMVRNSEDEDDDGSDDEEEGMKEEEEEDAKGCSVVSQSSGSLRSLDDGSSDDGEEDEALCEDDREDDERAVPSEPEAEAVATKGESSDAKASNEATRSKYFIAKESNSSQNECGNGKGKGSEDDEEPQRVTSIEDDNEDGIDAEPSMPPIEAKPSHATATATAEPFIPEIDVPKRRRSAYNLFFQHERARLLVLAEEDLNLEDHPPRDLSTEEVRQLLENNPYFTDRTKRRHRKSHGKVSFMGLVQAISKSWKTVDAATKKAFEELAREDQARYRREWGEYKFKCRRARREALAKAARARKREEKRKAAAETEKTAEAEAEAEAEVEAKQSKGEEDGAGKSSKKARGGGGKSRPVKKRKIEIRSGADSDSDRGIAAMAAASRRVSLSPGGSGQTKHNIREALRVTGNNSSRKLPAASAAMPLLPALPSSSSAEDGGLRQPHDEIMELLSHRMEEEGKPRKGNASIPGRQPAEDVDDVGERLRESYGSLSVEFEADFDVMRDLDSFIAT